MSQQAVPEQDQLTSTYLQQLQALAGELCFAMDAIARNGLHDLQGSIGRQEMLCALLATMAPSIDHAASPFAGSSPPPFSHPVSKRKIQAQIAAIQQLNLQYAALLRHCGKSNALLASLCRSHTGQFEGARGSRLKRQTWSCEM